MHRVTVLSLLLVLLAPATAIAIEDQASLIEPPLVADVAAVDVQALLRVAHVSKSYGGAYHDDATEELVILLANRDAVVEDVVNAAGHTAKIRYVDHTESELLAGAQELWESWPSLAPGVELESIAVDSSTNGLVIRVIDNGTGLQQKVGDIERTAGSPVRIEFVELSREVPCTSRDSCYSPYRAGIRIKQGSPAVATCSMGFHVVNASGNVEATTAGHCGFTGTSNWYHLGNGFIGNRYGSLYPAPGGSGFARDITLISMANGQGSDLIYADGNRRVYTWGIPYQGQSVCVSRGAANTITCGSVTNAIVIYTGDACQCQVIGVKSNLVASPGDSGSPVYERVTLQGVPKAVALGNISTADGKFVNLDDALEDWGGWSVYTP